MELIKDILIKKLPGIWVFFWKTLKAIGINWETVSISITSMP